MAAGPGRSAVGPLLSFADPALEAAFVQQFHASRLPEDRLHLTGIVALDLILLVWKLAPRRRWAACLLIGLEAGAAAALLLWRRMHTASYLRHRSATMAVKYVVHALITQNNQPLGIKSTCNPGGSAPSLSSAAPMAQLAALGAALSFWLYEALLQLIPWTGMFAMYGRLPLKTAVWALAATVGALMLPPVAARRLAVSSQLCSTAPARYAHAVRRVCFVVAHMLPPALGAGVSEVAARLPEPVAYHMLSGLAQLLLSFVAPLMVLARSEHRARLEFAAAHGDRAAVAGLVQWRERWQLSPLEWCLLTAAVLCLSLFAATFHTSYTPIPAEATSL